MGGGSYTEPAAKEEKKRWAKVFFFFAGRSQHSKLWGGPVTDPNPTSLNIFNKPGENGVKTRVQWNSLNELHVKGEAV